MHGKSRKLYIIGVLLVLHRIFVYDLILINLVCMAFKLCLKVGLHRTPPGLVRCKAQTTRRDHLYLGIIHCVRPALETP